MNGTRIPYKKWDNGEPKNRNYAVFWISENAPGWKTKIAKAWNTVANDLPVEIFCEIALCSKGNSFTHF